MRIDIAQRRLHHAHELRTKGKAENHRAHQHDRHFDDRPSQILEVLEKRFRRFAFRSFPKLEDVAQRHARLVRGERNQTARGQTSAYRERIGIANLVLGDHLANFGNGERAALNDALAFLAIVDVGALHRPD